MSQHVSLLRRVGAMTIAITVGAVVFTLASPIGSASGRSHGARSHRWQNHWKQHRDNPRNDRRHDRRDGRQEELTLSTLKFFIEFNETNVDVGVQTLLGGEPYVKLTATGPDGRKILDLKPKNGLQMQGMSDFFFESAEPTLDELPIEEFLARFPEGLYEFETVTLEGMEQDGEARFTHAIPAGPVIVAPQEGDVVDRNNVVIRWEPVTQTTAFNPPQRPVNIIGYQVIVTRVDPLRVFSVDVGPDVTTVAVSPEILDADTEYELEIIAIEESDNQTISLLFFQTAP